MMRRTRRGTAEWDAREEERGMRCGMRGRLHTARREITCGP